MPRRQQTSATSANRTQLTPDDWIDAATQVLVEDSINAVRVDVLAKGLQVTRGSFYWHFRDRDDLLTQILKRWADAATEQLINRFERSGAAPDTLVRELANLPFRGRTAHRSAAIDQAIRAWARRDEMARRAVDDVDAKRLSYIAHCFVALGHSIKEAQHRAFLLYSYMMGEALLKNQGTDAQRDDRRRFVETLLLGQAPAENVE